MRRAKVPVYIMIVKLGGLLLARGYMEVATPICVFCRARQMVNMDAQRPAWRDFSDKYNAFHHQNAHGDLLSVRFIDLLKSNNGLYFLN